MAMESNLAPRRTDAQLLELVEMMYGSDDDAAEAAEECIDERLNSRERARLKTLMRYRVKHEGASSSELLKEMPASDDASDEESESLWPLGY